MSSVWALLAGLVLCVGFLIQVLQPVPALATPATGRIYIGATVYDTLEAAIAAATAGDTLTLTGGDFDVSSPVTIPAGKNLTLDLGGNGLISRIDDGGKRMLTTSGTGAFTLTNGRLTAVDTDGNGLTGGAIYTGASSLTITGIEATGFYAGVEGGVVRVSGQVPQVIITDNNFHDNSGNYQGGAIAISNSLATAVTTIQGNQIVSNRVSSGGGTSYGGGMSINAKGTLDIINNAIMDNSATADGWYYGFHGSHGGAMYIEGNPNGLGGLDVTLEGNTISRNSAQLYGGGICFSLSSTSRKDTINMVSGVFEDNYSDYAGGAIDYSIHSQPTLVMKNALFTDNTARRGGAIWACPTTRTTSYTTLGGAIIGNHLTPSVPGSVFTPTGEDIRFEGYDTDINGIRTDDYKETYHRLTLFDRTFLGDKVNWYADGYMDRLTPTQTRWVRYAPGEDPLLAPADYTDRRDSIGVYSEILSTGEWLARHYSEAKLVFIGNTARIRGGAISTNSDIQIGEQGDVSMLVTKEWLDLNGEPLTTGLPEFVYARLIRIDEHGGEYPLEAVRLSADTNWQHLFDKLPGRGLVGNEVLAFRYVVREEAEPLGYDASYVDATAPAGTTPNYSTAITNQQEKVSISGSKTWDDNNNQDGKRPASITIHLLQDNVEVATRVVTAANNWAWDFGDWPLYVNGELVNYAVTEDAGPDYSVTVQDYSLINKHTPGQTHVQVTKAWFDGNDQDGLRPQSVTVTLLADSRDTGKTITLSEANHWTGTFTELDMYAQGQLIAYSVEEVPVGNGYTWVTTGDAVHGYILTNTRTPDTIDISGRKTWDDQDDNYGVRPAQITLNLYANGLLVPGMSQTVVPDANGNWTWRWEGLPKNQNGKPIHYEVGEEKIPDYVVDFPDYGTAPLNAYDITNSYLPDVFNIPVRKFWADQDNQEGLRPASVTIKLFANGVDTGKTVTLTPENRWHATFTNLDKYDANGAPIYYRLEESSTLWLYRVAYRPAKEMTVDQLNHVDARSGATIENHRVPETVMVKGAKTWDDSDNQDGMRPASITIRLLKNGAEVDSRIVTAAEDWAWTFVNLPKYENGQLVTYTIAEDAVQGYQTSYSGYDVTNSHTPETVEVSGAKTWNDSDNQDGRRPTRITVRLHKNGTEIDSKTITATEGWAWTFADLPKYENGQLITYTITEGVIPAYTTQVRGFDLINSYEPPLPPDPTYPTLRVPLAVSKVLKNGILKGGEYTFQLKDHAGQVIAEATNAADGTVTFPDRTFSRVVTNWLYTIEEVPGTSPAITYDSTVYTVKISTRAVGNQLEATVVIEKNGVPSAGSMTFTNYQKVPPTGDKAWQTIALLVVASLVLMGGAYVLRARRYTDLNR